MLIAIDEHRNEVRVDERRQRRVLKRLAFHHVAPVATRISDRQKDRLVLALRLRERGGTPRIPIDRIRGVLAQVVARGAAEVIADRRRRSGVLDRESQRGREDEHSRRATDYVAQTFL